jgi:hypothetical protein
MIEFSFFVTREVLIQSGRSENSASVLRLNALQNQGVDGRTQVNTCSKPLLVHHSPGAFGALSSFFPRHSPAGSIMARCASGR